MFWAKTLAGFAAAAFLAHALPPGQQEYSLLLRGRMGSTASPANERVAVAYAPEVEAADSAQVLGQ
ncbi:hypothetical protein CCM_06148 [Cordyceps militaris CM01]|uniref:Uncharacterized protein n=1 Tax=Cordyceps militaris (strain CM01) TaxID=983644 RepID=G3JIZ4_CORMM|nr:uncharacterized protein CCM_06148 [Cordyceps militaris CM01]EGX91988.1 hypothetical protein CCM_06148 [Cordyceps militaris CM01]